MTHRVRVKHAPAALLLFLLAGCARGGATDRPSDAGGSPLFDAGAGPALDAGGGGLDAGQSMPDASVPPTGCDPGFTACGGECVAIDSDPRHCGGCARECGADATCVAGECVCAAGQVRCDGACVDPQTSLSYCGATGDCTGSSAGTTCAEGEVCADGTCQLTCSGATTRCGSGASAVCADLDTDLVHCGECDASCPTRANASPVCVSGECGIECTTGFDDCDDDPTTGCEAELSVDTSHCGRCRNVCTSGQTCTGGECIDTSLPNDLCAGAVTLSGRSGTRTDPFVASRTISDCGSGAELWYRITLSARQILYVDTLGSDFDTAISVRTGCGASAAQCDDGNDCATTQDQLVRVLDAGTYYVAVHASSASTTSGSLQLRWQTADTGNGDFTRITGSGTYSGRTSGSGVHTPGCSSGSGPEDGFYFTRCPGESGSITASTCSGATWDTVLSLEDGTGGVVACNDDTCSFQSSISGLATGPGVFVLILEGWLGDSGDYDLTVSGL